MDDIEDEDAPGFSTPELAALSAWADTPSASERILSVTFRGSDIAFVTIDTEPSHPLTDRVVRGTDGMWRLG